MPARPTPRRAWIERVARFGFAARGLVYILVGLLAAGAAAGMGSRATDPHGALRAVGRQPLGTAFLAVLACGLAAYAIWRFLQAGLDLERKGSGLRALAVRASFIASGIGHAGLAFSAASLAVGLHEGRSDVVRTSAASGAVLRLAAGTEIELRAGVEIRLDAWNAAAPAPGAAAGSASGGGDAAPLAAAPGASPPPGGATVDLRRGKVLARVGNTGSLAINARDTRTTSEGPARFVVLADENGRVAVATIAGKTRFAAGGKSVALPAGTASASQGGAPPEDPEHISEEVFLNVVWPTVDRHGEHAQIKGRATSSSVVTVRAPSGLETAAVGADGQFSVTVPVGIGKTPIEVEAEDLVGHTKQATTTLTRRPPPPPTLRPEATDLWKKQAEK